MSDHSKRSSRLAGGIEIAVGNKATVCTLSRIIPCVLKGVCGLLAFFGVGGWVRRVGECRFMSEWSGVRVSE